MTNLFKKSTFIICSCLLAINLQAQTTRYVTETGAGTQNGTSWANASNDLQAMINVSQAGDEVWVAVGTYKPNRRANIIGTITPNNRDNAFVLKKDVKIYGSFAGTETTLEQRTLPPFGENYPSILSGDFNGDDGENFTNMEENAYHVVISAGNAGDACLNGFTISGGNANGSGSISVNSQTIDRFTGGGMSNRDSSPVLSNVTISNNNGGGMSNRDSSPVLNNVTISNNNGSGMTNRQNSSPVLTNVTISGNTASIGGGMYNNNNSSPVLTNVIISGNTADIDGGGMYNNYNSSPVLNNVTISENTADIDGGGIYNYNSSPVLTNVNIIGNAAKNGGGIYNDNNSSSILTDVTIAENTAADNGGGMYNKNSSSPVVTNVSVIGNSAAWGGGIYNHDNGNAILINVLISENTADFDGGGMCNNNSSPVLTNVTISGNTAANNGSGVANYFGSTPQIRNSIIWGNTGNTNVHNNDEVDIPEYSHSLVEDVFEDGVILEYENPLFVDANNGDFSLQEGSPCIDAGNNELYLEIRDIFNFDDENDLTGSPRLYGTAIDLGAYEYQGNTSIKTLQTDNELIIYPNPVNYELKIESEFKINNVEICDFAGRVVETRLIASLQGAATINVSNLPQGIYLIKIYTDKGVVTKKIVKN